MFYEVLAFYVICKVRPHKCKMLEQFIISRKIQIIIILLIDG